MRQAFVADRQSCRDSSPRGCAFDNLDAYLQQNLINHLSLGVPQLHHMPTGPAKPLHKRAACKYFAAHQLASARTVVGGTDALAIQWDVRVQRNAGALGRRGDFGCFSIGKTFFSTPFMPVASILAVWLAI